MKHLLGAAAAIALSAAISLPAMAQSKPSGSTGHCSMTAQGNCVNKDPPAGWNFFTPSSCQYQLNSTATTETWYIFTTSGDYWDVVNPVPSGSYANLGQSLYAGCITGGTMGVYVTDTSTGAFEYVYLTPNP
jgi:hypothetical protein